MADRPLSNPLPADLPEDWTSGQIVAPSGADVGLSQQHGYNYLMEQVNAAQRAANAINESFDTISGKRTCRVTVGTSTAGWTQADCDYLCDGTDDQEELNAAIAAVYAKGGGEIAVLGGEYNLSEAWNIKNPAVLTGERMAVTLSGEPGASVLNLATNIYMNADTWASLRFSGLTFRSGNAVRSVNSQCNQIAFEACTFLNVCVNLSDYGFDVGDAGRYMLFRGNVMEFSSDPGAYALVVNIASKAGTLIDGNSIHAATNQLNYPLISASSGYDANDIWACPIITNNTVSTDSNNGSGIDGIVVEKCFTANNSVSGASVAVRNGGCIGNHVANGNISAQFEALIAGNYVKGGSINADVDTVVTGNFIAAPSDAAAILSEKYGANDIAADRTPSITGNSIVSGSIGIHLKHNDVASHIDPAQIGALVSGNRIWGCETPIQIDDNWSRCMVTGNMFPAGSVIVDNGTDNIIRLNSDDPGDSSGGGGGAAGVSSFKGRTGAVVPQSGDYTAAMVGAVASGAVQTVQVVSQTEYDALSTKNASTLYLIKE